MGFGVIVIGLLIVLAFITGIYTLFKGATKVGEPLDKKEGERRY